MGQSQPREDLFYNVEKNQFVKIEKSEAPKLPEIFTPELPQESDESNETMKPNKEEGVIIEFLYDIFKEKDVPPASEPLPILSDATPL